MSATRTENPSNPNQFVAYFEEPESGVPVGGTGWYHSSGQFEIRSCKDAFATSTQGTGALLRPNVAGPFPAKEQALADLQETWSE